MAQATNAEVGPDRKLVDPKTLKEFVVKILDATGVPATNSAIIAEILLMADRRGVHSHGVNRLEMYVHEVLAGDVNPKAKPKITAQSPSTAWVDGQNGLGMPLGVFCMNLAMKKAKQTGVGWVVVNHSNHYGIAGYYAMMAAEKGLIGMSFTNTSPLVVPTRASRSALGTNPIAVAAPTSKSKEPWVLDMATSTVPIGRIEIYQREKKEVPKGWGVDKTGKTTTSPDDILNGGGLSPLGGEEHTGGYKGYGLVTLVEIITAVLGGANMATQVPPWRAGRNRPANVAQCFIALDPKQFAPDFRDRLTTLIQLLKQLERSGENKEILVAGEPEYRATLASDRDGIRLHVNVIDALQKLADKLKVSPLELKQASARL